MDEPTIDCCICGAHGTIETALYRLASAPDTGMLEWECTDRKVICDDHQEILAETGRKLRHHQRMIVMSL